MRQHATEETVISLPDILSALSFALDLTEGAVPGHAIRSTVLGMRLAKSIELPQTVQDHLFYALQLKDVGCSSNAARMSTLFGGDDRSAKAASKLTDFSGFFRSFHDGFSWEAMRAFVGGVVSVPRDVRSIWHSVLPDGSTRARIQRLNTLSRNRELNTRELLTVRCDRGASIMRKLEMSDLSCDAVHKLDERWDGSGYPEGLSGRAIPVLARILSAAQTLDAFAMAYGPTAAMRTLRQRSGTWFDPTVVEAAEVLHRRNELWECCEPDRCVEESRAVALSMAPKNSPVLRAEQIDTICEAFAEVVDAKSPFTFRHSMGVTEAASALAAQMGLDAERRKLMRRVALLHDLGKLGISNTILDKPGHLSPEERRTVEAHPAWSAAILRRISGFEQVARIAGEHHERLDGTGYPNGLRDMHLSLESRILMMADVFSALAEKRPYREAMPLEKVMSILRVDVPHRLDAEVFTAMEAVAARWAHAMPAVYLASDNPNTCELWRPHREVVRDAVVELGTT